MENCDAASHLWIAPQVRRELSYESVVRRKTNEAKAQRVMRFPSHEIKSDVGRKMVES